MQNTALTWAPIVADYALYPAPANATLFLSDTPFSTREQALTDALAALRNDEAAADPGSPAAKSIVFWTEHPDRDRVWFGSMVMAIVSFEAIGGETAAAEAAKAMLKNASDEWSDWQARLKIAHPENPYWPGEWGPDGLERYPQ